MLCEDGPLPQYLIMHVSTFIPREGRKERRKERRGGERRKEGRKKEGRKKIYIFLFIDISRKKANPKILY